MHRRLLTSLLCLFLLPALAGCYSLGQRRTVVQVMHEAEPELLEVEVWEHEGGFGSPGVFGVLAGLVWYPFDLLRSAEWGVRAAFDEEYEVRGNVFGVLAGMALPYVTAGPLMMPRRGAQGRGVAADEFRTIASDPAALRAWWLRTAGSRSSRLSSIRVLGRKPMDDAARRELRRARRRQERDEALRVGGG